MLLKKIVIAEDDDAIAHMVNMALGDAGFLCLRAKGGDEALRLVRVHTPDLLVLDVMMPGVDGLEVARQLRADMILSKTPILMLTALASVESKVEGLEAGADDYLAKPFDLRELAARVKALIRASRRERDRNPTTSLPGSSSVESQLDALLRSGDHQTVVHFDVAGFDAWADHVGFARADQAVAELGSLFLERVKAHSDGEGFLGHLGGTDFVAVARPDEAEALAGEAVDAFVSQLSDWADDTGAATGDAAAQARELGGKLTLAIAVAPTDGLGADDGEALADRMASAMREAKERGSSGYVVWKSETA
jgi:DNA-binding response OmpR family regulator